MKNDFGTGIIAGLILAWLVWFICSFTIVKDKVMTIQYPDGTFIKGIRKAKYVNQETRGTHHFMVTDATDKTLVGKRVAIPINSVKYFIIEGK
jgi:hypothetical protein